ncbi:MAG: glycosyltransferase family 2 protein [Ferruginibacter sp.]
MPAYNAEKWVKASLLSVTSQTWTNLEIIVVNDGSVDETEKEIQSVEDSRIIYLRQENKGQAAACNTGLQQATGAFIKFFDADDVMNPEHIEAQLDRLKDNENAIASCAWGKFNSNDSPLSAKFIPETVWKDMQSLAWLKAALHQPKDMMGACLWLIPRAVMEKAGGWDERLSLNNDFEFSIRLLLHADEVLFTGSAKIYYRSIHQSLSKVLSRSSVEAMLLSTRLGCSYLLAADGSDEMKKLCANRYQDWVYQVYPLYPDLVQKMETIIAGLGGSDLTPQGGRIFRLLMPVIGWKSVKRIQQLAYRNGYLKTGKKK